MIALTRRNFLGFAEGALTVAIAGAIGVRFIDAAQALPVSSDLGKPPGPPDLLTHAQLVGPSRGPGWRSVPGRRRPPPPRRHWVCRWHRGRRHCGWRWRWR